MAHDVTRANTFWQEPENHSFLGLVIHDVGVGY
jgi:hypothetical protein